MSDKSIVCVECAQPFTFTASEQEFYQERGFAEPRRCASCRASRKAQLTVAPPAEPSNGHGSRGFSAGGFGGSRQLFPTVCSACGKETEVPFQPRTDKPVYCRECFQEKRSAAPRFGSAY